jgi:hypothetical protein
MAWLIWEPSGPDILFGTEELQAQIIGLKKSGPWDVGCAANQALR